MVEIRWIDKVSESKIARFPISKLIIWNFMILFCLRLTSSLTESVVNKTNEHQLLSIVGLRWSRNTYNQNGWCHRMVECVCLFALLECLWWRQHYQPHHTEWRWIKFQCCETCTCSALNPYTWNAMHSADTGMLLWGDSRWQRLHILLMNVMKRKNVVLTLS